ncbi:MAG TPA: sigma-70 family RNA polymerase sigma factor [Candidatus Polarisedimenticolia bacterium]|nr:sigma-70 family RNA polymerase sigma factor [Candidatus Polarisedimenticolia bacterium]
MAEIRPGIRGTFEQLARSHMRPLYTMAVRLTHNPQEAEDLVQETLLRAYRFFDKYEQGSNFKAWLFKILKNSFINRYRKGQQQPETVDFGAIEDGLESLVDVSAQGGQPPSPDPEKSFFDGVVDSEIEDALAGLPPEYRMVFLMAVQEEMSYKEIAAALSIPIGTVMSRLHRARRLMQARLLEYARRRGLVDPTAEPSRPPDVVDIGRFRRKGRPSS